MDHSVNDRIILVTNDDGIGAAGLKALTSSLQVIGNVVVVAPEQEQSASSHSITLDKPLRIKKYSPHQYGVSGTPTDCVLLAVHGILGRKPDIIVSGINHGPNMGEDVNYSGTVAAAIEGNMLGIPSIAVSIVSWKPVSFDGAAETARYLAAVMIEREFPSPALWNVNVPHLAENEIRGIKITKLGSRVYKDVVIRKEDPRGEDYFWIAGGDPGWSKEENTDYAAVSTGYISVTPMHLDFTDYKSIVELKGLDLKWNRR